MPRPAHVAGRVGCHGPAPQLLLASSRRGAGYDLLRERWHALGIAAPQTRTAAQLVTLARDAALGAQAYRLAVDPRGVRIVASDADGEFYAWTTLAQLATKSGADWSLPCVAIDDAPAMRWRILSDDVSRGPLPTMRYFRERIRTIASFKMNGYSPYMEHVFADPKHPLPAPLDGITPAQLRDLDAYSRRFHVAFIPEQQTFAHMHGTLRYERYAPLAELPHGFLISPANPAGEAYVRDLISDELAVVPHPPFFHIGSDEPSDLGRGASAALVAAQGEGAVYARHVLDTAAFVAAHGPRPLLWDDAVSAHPELFAQLPKSLVFVNWHYRQEKTFVPYIERIRQAGFEQLVAPGADNWNQFYPDLDVALGNIARFTTEGKNAHVLGLFQTVWHDDGETLFEATWAPVLYAAASAWESGTVDRARFLADFPGAFFGSGDAGFASDLEDIAAAQAPLREAAGYGGSDALFWADPFAPGAAGALSGDALATLRLKAEAALAHLRLAPPPPLHAAAARTLFLAARRYDALGRDLQIAKEARDYYDDARANAGLHENYASRGLSVAKYLFWEERDTMLELEPLVRAAWEYENRPSHEASVLERYHLAADRAIERADRIAGAARAYENGTALPAFDQLLHD
jgi:hypothetical protein